MGLCEIDKLVGDSVVMNCSGGGICTTKELAGEWVVRLWKHGEGCKPFSVPSRLTRVILA